MDNDVPDDDSAIPGLKRTRRGRRGIDMAAAIARLPPHSMEAEQGVIGCMLLSPNPAIDEAVSIVSEEMFYDLRHQTIFGFIIMLWEREKTLDLLILQQEMKDSGQLDAIGGVGYLSALYDIVPSAANIEYYAEVVKEKYVLRELINGCTRTVIDVYENEGKVAEIVDQAEVAMSNVAKLLIRAAPFRPMKELINGAITTIEEYHKRQGEVTGIPTGFADIDKATCGMHPGEMIVIAGRPSQGKTSLAMNIAENVAVEHKMPVGVFSLEMTSESLVLRMLCSRARVNMRNIRDGFLAERDFPKLTGAAGKLSQAPIFIDDSSSLSILQLRAKARRMWQQHQIKLFVIDYLQLLNSPSRRSEQNRQQEIADISSGIKGLAKELGVPIIVLAQLNRELEKDRHRKPRLSDLRESGSIEQDADMVGLLYDPNRAEDDDAGVLREDSDCKNMNLLVAKQRNGPTGDIPLLFMKSYTRFESAARVNADDVPTE